MGPWLSLLADRQHTVRQPVSHPELKISLSAVLLRDTHTEHRRKRHNESDCSWCIIISLPASLAARRRQRVNSRATCSAALHNNNHRAAVIMIQPDIYSHTHSHIIGPGAEVYTPRGHLFAQKVPTAPICKRELFSHFCMRRVLIGSHSFGYRLDFLWPPGGICYCRRVKFWLCAREDFWL